MTVKLKGRHFLKLEDFSRDEIVHLLDLAVHLKELKKEGREEKQLTGKNIALIIEGISIAPRKIRPHDGP